MQRFGGTLMPIPRSIYYAFFICIAIIIFTSLSFYETYSEEVIPLKNLTGKVAVVYAAPTFHEEVVSVFACLLHEMGYFVVVYVGSGVHVGGMVIPFSGRRKQNSKDFYGKCVDQWSSIRSPIQSVKDPAIMVFVTYPMVVHDFKLDANAYDLLSYIKQKSLKTPVVLVTHRTNEFLPSTANIEKFIPRNQTYYMFLGEHTYNTASQLAQEAVVKSSDPTNNYQLRYIIPTMPIGYITNIGSNSSVTAYKPMQPGQPVFAIQGNFGGKHAHRKNPKGTVECIRKIEHDYPALLKANSAAKATAAATSSDAVVVKGNASTAAAAGGGRLLRRMYDDPSLYKPQPRHHQRRLSSNSTVLPYSIPAQFNVPSNRTLQPIPPLSISMIGRINGKLNMDTSLPRGEVRFYSGLDSRNFYLAIARSRFMVVSIGEAEYFTQRATSSVPAALITNLPIISTASLLKVYPCIRNKPIHQLINKETECESIFEATQLTEKQYQMAKQEVAECSRLLWNGAKGTLTNIVAEAAGHKFAPNIQQQ